MTRPCVLVFAGLDPSGGAGISADIEAIAANGAHALPIVTALTVQDNNRVHSVEPVEARVLLAQAEAIIASIKVSAVKIGIPGCRLNAEAIAACVRRVRECFGAVPVVLDPVLSSGGGDPLARGNALEALQPLLEVATLVLPNLPEAAALPPHRIPHVLVTGGHADGAEVVNRWYGAGQAEEWRWPRLPGSFHGSGCTLASAIAAGLACGLGMRDAIVRGQVFTHGTLLHSFAPGPGQRIPLRIFQEPR
jgi:hydroxymethylpyrimidine/phosphomethylpyrimidine kinase